MRSLLVITGVSLALFASATAAPQQQPQLYNQQNQQNQPNDQFHQFHHNQRPNQQPNQSGEKTTPIPIVSYVDKHGPDGSFNNSYESANGIKSQQSGVLKKVTLPRFPGDGLPDNAPAREAEVLIQSGAYEYMSPDGQIIKLSYTADENGFHPVGDHLPTSPPVPEGIRRLLENDQNQNRARPEPDQNQFQNQHLQRQPDAFLRDQPTTFQQQNRPSNGQQTTLHQNQQPSTFSQDFAAASTQFAQTSPAPARDQSVVPAHSDSVSQTLAETGTHTPLGPTNFEVVRP